MSAPQPFKVNASEHEIEKVTVYQSDRAAIQRRLPLQLEAGQNEVIVERLPTVLEEDTIRVEIEPTSREQSLTVYDVIHSPPESVPSDTGDKELTELEDLRATLVASRESFKKQQKVLTTYADAVPDKELSPENIAKLLDVLESKAKKIHSELYQIKKELSTVDKKLAEARKRTNTEHEAKQASRVTVIVLASKAGSAELVLSYLVRDASWHSLYDVRADIDSISNEVESNNITLQYRASITQKTGEDWNRVSLTLSTASPLLGTEIPRLRPWRIRERNARPSGASFAKASKFLMERDVSKSLAPDYHNAKSQDDLPFYALGFKSSTREAAARQGAISSTFDVEGLSTIPSDESSHKVAIATLELSADLEWVSVPRTTPSAFLQCLVKNTSEFLLISGPSNVFMDGNFVSKSSIPDVSPQESFSCSLGVDPSIRITYHPQKKVVRTGSSTMFGSPKTEITNITQLISIKNTRSSAVSRLVIKDQVPESEDSRIHVSILRPSEKALGPSSSPGGLSSKSVPNSGVQGNTQTDLIRTGLIARWAQKHDENGGWGGAKGDGVIEWIGTGVQQSLDIELEYEVSAPRGLRWE